MNKMTQFKAAVTLALTQTRLPHLRNMMYQNANNFDYVGFFSSAYIRNTIIPEFDHVNDLLQCTSYTSNRPTVYDNKFMHLLKDNDVAPTDNALDLDFWSHYVRDCIHTFIRKTWSYDSATYGIHITVADADQIIMIMRKVRSNGPRSYADWKDNYKDDMLYSSVFDVKMCHSEIDKNKKRPVYLYSYGSKGWANCMAFLLRMQWNNLCSQNI